MKKLLILVVVLGLVCVSLSAGTVHDGIMVWMRDSICVDFTCDWVIDPMLVFEAMTQGSYDEGLGLYSYGSVPGIFWLEYPNAFDWAEMDVAMNLMVYGDGETYMFDGYVTLPTIGDLHFYTDGTWALYDGSSMEMSGNYIGGWMKEAPEPTTLLLLATGLGGIGLLRRR